MKDLFSENQLNFGTIEFSMFNAGRVLSKMFSINCMY